MTVSEQEKHLVYLLKRKSDSKQYVGITIQRRFKIRMGDHKRSNRFKGDDFDVQILEESNDRNYIEGREEYWINSLDTFNNGLNESPSGKGCGHNSPNFTTLGYKFSDEQRKKMSESAKKRAKREGFHIRSKRSKENCKNPEYIRKQKESKSGKRLRPPKLTDNQVDEIRDTFAKELDKIKEELIPINEERRKKNSGWKPITPYSTFARKYCEYYNVTAKCIADIVSGKTRTERLPSIYKS